MNKLGLSLIYAITIVRLAASPSLTIDAGHPGGKVSPQLYGLMTEEISHCYDGGLYAELIRNRAFLDDARTPVHWAAVTGDGPGAKIALDPANPYNDKLTTSSRLTVDKAARDRPAGVANDGYWGIPARPNTRYCASLIVRSDSGWSGPLTVSIVGEDGKRVYAAAKISGLDPKWQRFAVTLKTGRDLEPYVQEALEEIEYVTGHASTPWGARRARDGHPKPFPLTYVEIGNEDWFGL
jgi:alpha-N-arabinofuranosidase